MRIPPARRVDYGLDVGGYIFKDKLWFFAAYDRVDTPGTASRYVSTPAVPNTLLFPRDQTDDLFAGKLTWNIAPDTNLVATAFSDPSPISGAALVGSGRFTVGLISNPDPGTWETRREIGGLDFGLRLNRLFGASAVVTAQASQHKDRFELFAAGAGAGLRTEDWTCAGGAPNNPCLPGIAGQEPNSVTGGLGFIGGPSQKNRSRRDQYRLDGAFYVGNHEVKLGGDYQRGKTTTITSITGGQLVQKYNDFGQTYYTHIFFSKSLTDLTPVDDVTEAHSFDTGFYLQDSWKPLPGLTINAGLRWDEQSLSNSVGQTVLETTGEWQPRLGIVWDPSGHGSARVYAFAGRFYFSLPTALSIFAYGTTTFAQTFNFSPLDRAQDPTVIGHEKAFVSVQGFSEPVEAGLKGSYQDELTLGIEKLLDPTLSIGLKGTYRRLGRAIEDRCGLDYMAPENNFSSCAIINPGSNGKYARGDFPSCNGLDPPFNQCQQGAPPIGPARRLYRGIELSGRKSLGEKLWLQASYVYSSLRGNYDGYVRENIAQTFPGFGADFDYPQGLHNNYGRLFLDRPHSFRLDASYSTPFKLFVGLQAYVQSGVRSTSWGTSTTPPPLASTSCRAAKQEPFRRSGSRT